MAYKENKGGLLTPEQVEKDNAVKGSDQQAGGYVGSQDTGDNIVRQLGSEVQQQDGFIEDDDTA